MIIENLNDYDLIGYWRQYTDTSGMLSSKLEEPIRSWRRKHFNMHKYPDPCRRWGLEYYVPGQCCFGSESESIPAVFETGQQFITSVIPFITQGQCPPQPNNWAGTGFGTVTVQTRSELEEARWDADIEYYVTLMNYNPLTEDPDSRVSVLLSLPKENRIQVAVSHLEALSKAISEVYP